GRVDEDAVAGGAEAGYLRLDRPLEGLDAPEPEPRHRLPHPLEASGLSVEGEHAAAVLHELGEVSGLGPGRGARIRDRLAGARLEQSPDEHRRLVLDDEAPVGEGSPAPRGAAGPDHEPLGRPAGESPGEALLRGQARGERLARDAQDVRAERDRWALVHGAHQGVRLLTAEADALMRAMNERPPVKIGRAH